MSPSCARRVFGKPGGGGEKRRRREMDFKLVQDFRVAFLLDGKLGLKMFVRFTSDLFLSQLDGTFACS